MSAKDRPTAAHAGRSGRTYPDASYGVIAIVAVLAHAGALVAGLGYVYDDVPIVVDNPLVAGLGRAGEWFTSGYWPGHELYYRPLVIAGYALERTLFGGAAAAAHAVNLGWHVVVALLVAALARRLARVGDHAPALERTAGLAAGVLVAAHPLLAEPVYWISARSDLLGAAATLGAILVSRAGGLRSLSRGVLVGLVALAGLLCKESVAVLPFVLLLDGAWRRRYGNSPSWQRVILPSVAGALLAALAYAGLRALAFGSALGLAGGPRSPDAALYNPLVGTGAVERLLTPLAVLAVAAARALWPDRLSSDYAAESIPLAHHLGDVRVIAGVLLVALGLAIIVRSLRGRGVAAWGLVFAAVTWLPASNTLLLGGALFGERFVYLPATGIAIALAVPAAVWGARMSHRARVTAAILFTLVCTTYAVRDHVRARDWRTNGTLYASVVRSYPENAQGHYNLGVLALEHAMASPPSAARDRELEKAEASFQRAARILPDYVLAHVNIGVARAERGDWTGALEAYRTAETLAPDDARVQYNLGVALENLGARDAAIEHYRRSAALVPGGGPGARAVRRLVTDER